MFKGIGTLLLILAIGFFGFIGFGIYETYRFFFGQSVIESKTLINPEIKLHTDGKVIDTIYVYRKHN